MNFNVGDTKAAKEVLTNILNILRRLPEKDVKVSTLRTLMDASALVDLYGSANENLRPLPGPIVRGPRKQKTAKEAA
jgi:hypothetical protein